MQKAKKLRYKTARQKGEMGDETKTLTRGKTGNKERWAWVFRFANGCSCRLCFNNGSCTGSEYGLVSPLPRNNTPQRGPTRVVSKETSANLSWPTTTATFSHNDVPSDTCAVLSRTIAVAQPIDVSTSQLNTVFDIMPVTMAISYYSEEDYESIQPQ